MSAESQRQKVPILLNPWLEYNLMHHLRCDKKAIDLITRNVTGQTCKWPVSVKKGMVWHVIKHIID